MAGARRARLGWSVAPAGFSRHIAARPGKPPHRARTEPEVGDAVVRASPPGLPDARHTRARTPYRALGEARATRTVRCEVHSLPAAGLLAVALPRAQQAHSAAPSRSPPLPADRVGAPLAGDENPRMGVLREGSRDTPPPGANVTNRALPADALPV